MERTDRMTFQGDVLLVARDAQGRLKGVRHARNLMVTAGLQWMSGALSGDTATPNTMKYIGIGTGSTAATNPDTALGVEAETPRATGTQSRVTTTLTNDTYQVVGTLNITANRALAEAGLFSATTNGTMLCRQTFSVINLVSGDTIEITWKIKGASG